MPRPTDYRNPETNMHGTFKVYNYPIPKADPRFPVRTENTRGTRRQRIRRAKREAAVFPMFGRYGRTFLRQTPRGVPKRPKDGPAQPAIRSRKDGEALPPVETTTTARYARPAESGRKDKEPDRLKRKPTDTRRAYESPGTPCLRRRGSWNTRISNPSRPRIRTGTRPKASDRLRLNRAARP